MDNNSRIMKELKELQEAAKNVRTYPILSDQPLPPLPTPFSGLWTNTYQPQLS